MAPVLESALTFLGKQTLRRLIDTIPSTQRSFEEARDDLFRDAVIETEAALNKLIARQEQTNSNFLQALELKTGEREVVALISKLLKEAAESATRERVRLLAAGIAGAFRPDLDAEMKSRVARALISLEPSDIALLRKRPFVAEPDLTEGETDGDKRYKYNALILAGCVMTSTQPRWGDHPTFGVTPIGRALLKFVEEWEPDAAPYRSST